MIELAKNYWRHDGHFTPPTWREMVKSRFFPVFLAVIVLNEVRGIMVAMEAALWLWG